MRGADVRDVWFVVRHRGIRLSVGIGAALGGLLLLGGYPRAHALLVRSRSLRAADREAVLSTIPLLPSSLRAQLGVQYLYDPLIFDPQRALVHLLQAVRESPFDFRNWVHLGQGYEAVGDRARAEAAYRRALACAPAYFLPRWLYANFLLKRGERERAIEAFAHAARANPEAVANIAELLQDADALRRLDHLAGRTDVRVRVCAFLLARGAFAPALALWRDLAWGADEGAKLGLARALIARGIAIGEAEEAHRLWREVSERLYGRATEDLIWNGGFEHPLLVEKLADRRLPAFDVPLDRGFEWTIEDQEGVVAEVVREGAYEGGRALRLTFVRPEGVRFSGVAQLVLLRPATTYELRFAYRADLRGDPRVVVEIVDAPQGAPRSDRALVRWEIPQGAGRSEWRLVRAIFRTSPTTSLALLRIRREPADSLADFVKGRLWFDAFALRPSGAAEEAGA
jgi:tetratricopeptide (TPR) repeat protein